MWFSCGAASAIAAKLAVEHYPSQTVVVNCDTTSSEHPDNKRFLLDVEQWIGAPIVRIKSRKYTTVEEVFEGERYMSGIAGAKCTVELKKRPRFNYQMPGDTHVFGFTSDEKNRIALFNKNNHDLNLWWVLEEHGISKDDCYERLKAAGIPLPVMYQLGYKNNNCMGCVKSSSPAYWLKIKADFPDVFERRCIQSRSLGVKLVRVRRNKNRVRIFLDELTEEYAEPEDTENISCGPDCK